MNFSCDRCGKRFTTSDDPVPGRTYRIPCACGNDVVLEIPAAGTEERRAPFPRSAPTPRPRSLGGRPPRRGGDPFAPPAASEPLPDDPFAAAPVPDVPRHEPVVPPSLDVTPTMDGPLARRDPDAPADESAEYRVTSALSFDDVLRRARRRGFLVGAVVGAVAAAAIAVGLAVATSRTSPAPHGPAPASASADAPAPAGPPSAPMESSAPPSSASGAPASPVPDTATAATAVPDARRGAVPGNGAPAAPPSRPARPVPDTAAVKPNTTVDAKSVVPDTELRLVPESEGAEGGGGAVPDTEGADGEARSDVAGEVASSGPAPEGDRAEDERGGGDAAGPEGDAGAAADEPADPQEAPREAEVKAALAARQEALDECIALAPGEPAAARGQRFRLVVSVEPTGAVSDARVDDAEIARTPLGVCLVEIARTLRFPAFGGEPTRVEVRVRHGVAE